LFLRPGETTTFIYPAEDFPVDVRTTGHGIAAGAGKLGAFAGAFPFPDFLAVTLGLNRAMVITGVAAALGMLLTIATLPEPKGKTLERLEEIAYEPLPAKVRTQGPADPARGGRRPGGGADRGRHGGRSSGGRHARPIAVYGVALGSVSLRCAASAPCPVTPVKLQAEEPKV
jgi:hypothetical protein